MEIQAVHLPNVCEDHGSFLDGTGVHDETTFQHAWVSVLAGRMWSI
jgi:hypothetical protein